MTLWRLVVLMLLLATSSMVLSQEGETVADAVAEDLDEVAEAVDTAAAEAAAAAEAERKAAEEAAAAAAKKVSLFSSHYGFGNYTY